MVVNPSPHNEIGDNVKYTQQYETTTWKCFGNTVCKSFLIQQVKNDENQWNINNVTAQISLAQFFFDRLYISYTNITHYNKQYAQCKMAEQLMHFSALLRTHGKYYEHIPDAID